MKKVISLVVVLLLAISLVACSPTASTETESTDSADASEEMTSDVIEDEVADTEEDTAQEEWEIAIVPKDTTNNWFQVIAQGGAAYGEEHGVKVFMKGGSEADAALQINVIKDLIASGVDALCVIPNDIAALEPVLKEAQDAGIVVICHEASTQENCLYDIEAFDNAGYGGAIMDSLAKAMGEEGKYIIYVGSLTNGSHNEWADGGIAQQLEAYPNMELIEERIEIQDDVEVAYQKTKELIKKYPDLKGFLGTSAMALPGMARAIQELGLEGKVFAAGMGLPAQIKEYLESDTIESAVLWDPYNVGYALASLATKVLNGEEITDGADLGVEGYESMMMVDDKVLLGAGWLIITKDNVGSFDF